MFIATLSMKIVGRDVGSALGLIVPLLIAILLWFVLLIGKNFFADALICGVVFSDVFK